MTDEEMAEEYANENKINFEYPGISDFVWEELKQAFLAGLKASRPEWHKVDDGDLPNNKEYVLIYTDLNNYYVAEKVENHFMSKGWGFIPMSTVIVWCEIPKYTEE